MTEMKYLFPAQHDRIRRTAEKISGFKHLQYGWHYGEGAPPSEETINSALALNQEAAAVGFTRTNAFPGIEGEIQVTIYHGPAYLEFTIEPDGRIALVREHDQQEVESEENLSLSGALARIRSLKGLLWVLSESSIRSTTTQTPGLLRVWPSNPPAAMAAYPSLTKSVSETVAPLSANISSDITKVFLESRPFFGKFPTTLFRIIPGSSSNPATREMSAITT